MSAQLPEGWTSKRWSPSTDRWLVIKAPVIGYVTVDFEIRGYRGGSVVTGPTSGGANGAGAYCGRGWRDRLIADAIDWLAAFGAPRTRKEGK